MIICLEGLDASGKQTQSKLLAESLNATLFSFPAYDAPFGAEIRGHLKRDWSSVGPEAPDKRAKLDAMVFQCVQLANKAAVAPDILAAAAKGHVVLDRYWPSACVYAVEDGFTDVELLIKMHQVLPQPDMFILLDVPMEEVQRRLEARAREKDRYELQPLATVAARLERYRRLWLHAGWKIVDGTGTRDEVARRLYSRVMEVV